MYTSGSGVVDATNCPNWNAVVTGSATSVVVSVATTVVGIGTATRRVSNWVITGEVPS